MFEQALPYLSLVGDRTGRIKDLSGYRKPASLGNFPRNPIAGLGTEEITRAGEELFSAIRPAFGYKRKDIAFSVEGPSGIIACRDFEVSIELLPNPDSEDAYLLRKTISSIRSEELFEKPEFNELFAATFQRIELRSATAVSVEEWIDRVEDRDLEEEWQLRYPPDYSHCSLRLPGSEFEIRITPDRLVMGRLLPAPPLEFFLALKKLGPVLQASPSDSRFA
jgi:hypothetical protein